MPKATSTRNGGAADAAARKAQSAERKAAKVVEAARDSASKLRAEAKADAARIRAEAEADAVRIRSEGEEHARRIILDARASADGVRAEGMELVSNLRLISDSLRSHSDHLQRDIESIHARMVGELEDVEPNVGAGPSSLSAKTEDELDVPEFVQPH